MTSATKLDAGGSLLGDADQGRWRLEGRGRFPSVIAEPSSRTYLTRTPRVFKSAAIWAAPSCAAGLFVVAEGEQDRRPGFEILAQENLDRFQRSPSR